MGWSKGHKGLIMYNQPPIVPCACDDKLKYGK